jgi:transcriptional regulator with GAF, ATPase, and Fis domain
MINHVKRGEEYMEYMVYIRFIDEIQDSIIMTQVTKEIAVVPQVNSHVLIHPPSGVMLEGVVSRVYHYYDNSNNIQAYVLLKDLKESKIRITDSFFITDDK